MPQDYNLITIYMEQYLLILYNFCKKEMVMITLIDSKSPQSAKFVTNNINSTPLKGDSFLNILDKISKKDTHLQKNNILLLNILPHGSIKKLGTSKSLIDKKNINEQLLALLDPSSLKFIIHNAKKELSSMIRNSSLTTIKDIKQMPKTLKGLLQLAKILKIDISKITLKSIINTKASQTIKTTTVDLKKSAEPTTKAMITPKAMIKLPAKLQKLMQTNLAHVPLFKEIKKNTATLNLTNYVTSDKTQTKASAQKTEISMLSVLLNKDTSATQAKPKSDIQNNLQQPQQNIQPTNALHVNTQHQTFTIKAHEAKQMVKYLAHSVKQAIDEYKPPFTKINLKLNPKKLGEVDLTVIQRGKNLHVNITSNNNAVNILSQNSNDLKVQLSQNGMNNATLNFSNSGNMSNSQNRQHQEDAKKIYRQLDEQNEDFANSLEIIIPRYI